MGVLSLVIFFFIYLFICEWALHKLNQCHVIKKKLYFILLLNEMVRDQAQDELWHCGILGNRAEQASVERKGWGKHVHNGTTKADSR